MSSVKVYLRIKPHLSQEEAEQPLPMETKVSGGRKKLHFQYRLQQSGTKIFTFDNIFDQAATQEEVYDEFRQDLLNSVVNGVTRANIVQLLSDGLRPNFIGEVLHSLGREFEKLQRRAPEVRGGLVRAENEGSVHQF